MSDIMKLREITKAGIMDCKSALEQAGGNIEKAVTILREKGKASAEKKGSSDRVNSQGAVHSYIHMGGKIGVMVEINCETDFAAKSEEFMQLGKDLAMHIAAANPLYLNESDVPTADLEKEKAILANQAKSEGKPEAVVAKMVEGRVKKYYQDICLLNQQFVKDQSVTIKEVVADAIAKIGEKITIRRFVRYEMGEGLAQKVDNFAEEVAKQMGAKQDATTKAKVENVRAEPATKVSPKKK